MPGTRTILKFSHFVNRTEAKEPQWSYPPVGGEPSENTSILSSPPVGSGDLSEKGQDGFPITNVGNDEADVRRQQVRRSGEAIRGRNPTGVGRQQV
jgi:hypothetical protein